MSKLNHLYNAEKILFVIKHIRNGGNNVLKAFPSIQWSLLRLVSEISGSSTYFMLIGKRFLVNKNERMD